MLKVKRWQLLLLSVLVIASMVFTVLPSPVQIGPLSFGGAGVASASTETTIQPSGNDTMIYENTPTTNRGNDTYYYTRPNYYGYQNTILMQFDLSALAGKTLISATLSMYFFGSAAGNGSGRNITIYRMVRGSTWKEGNGTAGTGATWNTYDGTNSWGTVGCKNTTTDIDTSLTSVSTVPSSYGWQTWNILTLAADALGNVSRSNQLVMRLSDNGGDVVNVCPEWFSKEYTGNTSQRPKLTIVYCDAPTIATLPATSITASSATLNGNVTAVDATCPVTAVGFVWSTSSHSAPTTAPSAQADYAGNWTSGTVNYTAGQLFDSGSNVTGLTSDVTYYFRAAGYNGAGWAYGNEGNFTTLPGGNLLSRYTNRIKVQTSDAGGGAITGDAEMFDALYNGAIIEADSMTQFLYRPAVRYVGTHDRTYIAGVNSVGIISIRQWDEDDLLLSGNITLWDAGSTFNHDDHVGCSIIVLQHQTGDNEAANGSVLVVGSHGFFGDYLGSRRSINLESIGTSSSDWGASAAMPNPHDGVYPNLVETTNGTIWCFSQERGVPEEAGGLQVYYRILTIDPDNPSNDSWSDRTLLASLYGDNSAYHWTYEKAWGDGADIHLIFMRTYVDIFYIKYQGSDNTWRTAGGTQKYLPLDCSAGNQTPDFVYDTLGGNSSAVWDIKTDALHNPYLLFYNGVAGNNYDLYRSIFTGGAWVNTDTTIDGITIGSNTLMSGADLDEDDMDTIYAAVPDGSGNAQIQEWHLSGVTWSKVEDVTQSSPGDNFRPIHVLNGAGHFEILWFYTERYVSTTDWGGMRLAYPGFSSQNFLCLNKTSRTDFGDLRLTLGDGSTLQPSASSGTPWIQEKTDLWRAICWWKVGNIPITPGKLTNYVYFGNSTNTNANTQAIMDAQFLAADHFDTANLDTAKWTLQAGNVTQSSSNLELTAGEAAQGLIDGNVTNYPLFTYAEVRFREKGSDSTVGDTSDIGLRGTGSWNEMEVVRYQQNIANFTISVNKKGGVQDYTWLWSQDTANWHIWRIAWTSDSVATYNDMLDVTSRTIPVLQSNHTDTSKISTSAQGLTALEGVTASSGVIYVDWMFARPCTNPMPIVSALTQEYPDIFNTPSSHNFGVVQPSQTYWANGQNGNQAFVSYTEVDPGSHISVASSAIAYTGLTMNQDAYVYKDFGADFFDEDFHFYVDYKLSSSSDTYTVSVLWMLANDVNDMYWFNTNYTPGLWIYTINEDGVLVFVLCEEDPVAENMWADNFDSASLDTTYYLDIWRDESIGSFGKIFMDIYASSSNRENKEFLLYELKLLLHEKRDFRYLYGLNSYNSGSANDVTGWVSNLQLFTTWPLESADCWGNLTNNSSFAVDILASMTDMTGGTTWSIGSSPGTNVFTLKIGIAGTANIGNFTTLSNTPVAWITSMAAGNMTRWTMVFYTPTNSPQFADGTPKSGNMTFAAEAS